MFLIVMTSTVALNAMHNKVMILFSYFYYYNINTKYTDLDIVMYYL